MNKPKLIIFITTLLGSSLFGYYSADKGVAPIVQNNEAIKCPSVVPVRDMVIHASENIENEKNLIVSKSVIYMDSSEDSKNPCPRSATDSLIAKTGKITESSRKILPKIVQEMLDFFKDEKLSLDELNEAGFEEELKVEKLRIEKLQDQMPLFESIFPRQIIGEEPPRGYLYYGVHSGDYSDEKQFLGKKYCKQPNLSYANYPLSFLGLFFTINEGRTYRGRVRIINEDIKTIIVGAMSISKLIGEKRPRQIPDGRFAMWVHKDIEKDYKGHIYKDSSISTESSYKNSPWLYNSCNESIATVSNICHLDQSFDMEYTEFFYLSKFDIILGTVYCKKRIENSWEPIARLEFVRRI
jgi:hypothetical protein